MNEQSPLAQRNECLIGGHWRPAASGETMAVLCPSDGKPFADIAAGGIEDLADAVMAFGASEDEAIDGALYKLTRAAGVPANIADVPEQCDFIMASIVDRTPLVIAVSSSGTAPILARMIRARLETMLPATYGRLAEFAGQFRELVSSKLQDGTARRKFGERAIYGPTADLVR